MKNITLSADEKLIEKARAKARSEQTTLNEQFRQWLTTYVGRQQQADAAMTTIKELQSKYSTNGQHFSREEMNER